ncbi:hypothetical protein F183_A19850 [Bryobacterales bacterium F-183]|nr:hypothetical protein F183_A19850 [Bryobacterales bacterium F-183]
MTAVLVLSVMLAAAAADPETAAREAVADFAAGLAQDNAEQALRAVSKKMDGYGEFADQIRALVRQNLVTSSVSPQSNTGDDSKRELELDWYVEIKSRNEDLAMVRRRETVRCTVERTGKNKWQITAIAPLRLFALPVF